MSTLSFTSPKPGQPKIRQYIRNKTRCVNLGYSAAAKTRQQTVQKLAKCKESLPVSNKSWDEIVARAKKHVSETAGWIGFHVSLHISE